MRKKHLSQKNGLSGQGTAPTQPQSSCHLCVPLSCVPLNPSLPTDHHAMATLLRKVTAIHSASPGIGGSALSDALPLKQCAQPENYIMVTMVTPIQVRSWGRALFDHLHNSITSAQTYKGECNGFLRLPSRNTQTVWLRQQNLFLTILEVRSS